MSLLTCTGSLTIRERIAIPAESVATVKLVDSEGEVLAATAVDAPGVPVDFSLAVDEGFIDGDLFVWAILSTDVGAWGTLELEPFTEGAAIVLSKIEP